MNACVCSWRAGWLSAAILLSVACAAAGKPPALFPAGAQRGGTTEIEAGGSFKAWPIEAWVDTEGISIEPASEKGKLIVTIEDDVAPGLHWVRIVNEGQAQGPDPFFIGTLPEAVESEPNDDPRKPQVLAGTSVVVNGRLTKRGDVDGFAIALRRGQTLVASVEANRRLASGMDAVLQVASDDGFVLAQNDDEHGLDPQLVFRVPADGTYLVRTFAFPAKPDSTIGFAGDESFVYRLTLTTGSFLDHAWPMAVGPDTHEVELFGWNLPDDARRVGVLTECAEPTVTLALPCAANSIELPRVDQPSALEQEPNGQADPQRIALPVMLTGRIAERGDEDVFRFDAKKGEKIQVRAESRELGFPLDPVLRVLDAAGKVLAEQDDTGRNSRDATLNFTVPADGEYRVSLRDLNGQGGPGYVYRVAIGAPQPDFRLTAPTAPITASAQEPRKVNVTIDRQNGFDQPIEVRAVGLPEGIEADRVVSEPTGKTAKQVTLTLTARPGAAGGPFQIVGQGQGDPPRLRRAHLPIADSTETCPWLWVNLEPAPKKK